jgi:hypothetical protein
VQRSRTVSQLMLQGLQAMDHRSSKELKTREDWEAMLQSVDTVLFDCDGLSVLLQLWIMHISLSRCPVDWSRRSCGWRQ